MSGYGNLQNDSENHDDPDVDQSAEINEQDDCVSYTSHDSNEESPLIGNIFCNDHPLYKIRVKMAVAVAFCVYR